MPKGRGIRWTPDSILFLLLLAGLPGSALAGNPPPDPAIHRAVRSGSLETVIKLVRSRPELVRAKNGAKATPLHLAVERGRYEIAGFLFANGAPVDEPDGESRTPLMLAVKSRSAATLQAVIRRKPDPARLDQGLHAARLAMEQPDLQLLTILLEAGAGPDPKREECRAFVLEAMERRRETLARLLIRNQFPHAARNDTGLTPLHLAVDHCGVDLVRLLLAHGADPDARDNHQETPLHWAAAANSGDKLRALLAAKANPNLQNARGETALYQAAEGDHRMAVKILVQAGADQSLRTREGKTAWQRAVELQYPDTARLLKND